MGHSTQAQNLVINPSFENIVNCPTAFGSIEEALSWSSPTDATADYFHECDASNTVGIPANSIGFQSARTGLAYAGIQVFSRTVDTDYREYLQIPLINSLIADSTYSVRMFVSPADNLDDCFTDALGFHFADAELNEAHQTVLNVATDVQNTSGNFLTDKGNWLLISGTFTAEGGESHLIIGNFLTDAQTTEAVPCGSDEVAYYYIDDVSVELIPQLSIEGNDFVCEGESTDLQAVNGETYEWISSENPSVVFSTADRITVSPTATTTYTVSSGGETASITVNVQARPEVNLVEDALICQGTSKTLDATPSNTTDVIAYTWQDGSDGATFTADTGGNYSVEMEVNGCTFTESIELMEIPDFTLNFGADVLTICEGTTLTLNPQPGDAIIADLNFLWQDGSTDRQFTLSSAGTYSVTISNECFSKSDEVTVETILCDCLVTFPSAFSPNGDGINDSFLPASNCNLNNYQLTIYSRYGNEIYKNSDPMEGWDGRIDLEDADQKVYVWVATYQISVSSEETPQEVTQSGSILLLK